MATTTETALSNLGLTSEELRAILAGGKTSTFPRDAIVIREGERSDSLYIILEGRVKAFVIDPSGEEAVLSHLGPGEYFGGKGFDDWPQSASIMTVEPSRFLVLPKSEFRGFLPRNHEFATRIFEKLVREVDAHARELSEALQQKTAISEILRVISNSATNVQSVLEAVAENAARLCDVTDAEIMKVEGDELRLVAKYGQSRHWPIGTMRAINRDWVTGRAVVDHTTFHIPDLQEAEGEFPLGAASAKQYGHRTTFATPLLREGTAIGAILIRRMEVRPLTEKQIALIKTFADQAAIAIENVRLFNETREALERQTATSEILKVISRSPTDVQPVFDAIAKSCKRLFSGLDVALNMKQDEVFNRVAFLASSPEIEDKTADMFPMPLNEESLSGRAMVRAEMVHVEELSTEAWIAERSQSIFRLMGARSALCVPMMREGKAIGSIIVFRGVPGRFKDEQVALLQTFADQAVIAIENVRLFNEIQEKSRKLEEQAKELAEWNSTLETRVAEQVAQLEQLSKLELELTLASEIQKSMLPRSIPRLEGYEFGAHMVPAKSIGGDFFDFIPLGDDSLSIAIGDVSDKGVPAALFMAMVRSLLRAEAHPGQLPNEVLRSVNRHLMDVNDKEMFVTILFGILNRTTRQFQYARAGHVAPIIFDGKGPIKGLPKAKGQALGVFDAIILDEQTVALSEGRLMLLYSDGIPDATNRQNVSFGLDGIARTVCNIRPSSAQMVCDDLIKTVTEYQASSLQHDDMTVVVVRAV